MALLDIVAHKKRIVAERQYDVARIIKSVTPTEKSLYRALSHEKSAFICEVKFASPSRGQIRADITAGDVARIYAPFADTISVLADEKYFGGSYDVVREVSLAVSCPVLCKDVVVSPLQVYEARYHGADCVLLMLSVLNDEEFQECARVAASLNMDFICEVHTESEMKRANNLHAPIIGINNRNLKTLEINLETSTHLAPLAHENAILILESGFSHHHQIKQFSALADGFLVGTSLMKSPRIDLALRELIFGRIKICGLTNPQDAQTAYELGAYYGGLNFAPVSKRQVSVDEAKSIMSGAPLVWGGVFVNQPASLVADVALKLGLLFVQLHGDEDQDYINEVRALLPSNCELWRAVRVKNSLEIPHLLGVDRMLLDGFLEGCFGGTGQSFDWDLFAKEPRRNELIIAGGITPSTIKAASDLLPFAIDIASGVEDLDPRKKSVQKIKELFLNVRP
jgi:indole-3-glycerol phosphate synthase / phosphoribosylanthranilate isomerase